jgi:hypothetical protein
MYGGKHVAANRAAIQRRGQHLRSQRHGRRRQFQPLLRNTTPVPAKASSSTALSSFSLSSSWTAPASSPARSSE